MENKNTNNNGALKYSTKIIIIQVRVGVGHQLNYTIQFPLP